MADDEDYTGPPEKKPKEGTDGKKNKRLSVERIYQKKTQLEHILLRPDTYIGSVEPVTQVSVYKGHKIRNQITVMILKQIYENGCWKEIPPLNENPQSIA